MERVLEHMKKNLTNRPRKKKTLLSHLKSVLGKDATDEDAARMVAKLRKGKHLTIDDKESVHTTSETGLTRMPHHKECIR